MRDYSSFSSDYFKSPYKFNRGGYDGSAVEAWMKRQLELKRAEEQARLRTQVEDRGFLDRTFDFLLTPNSVVAGFADGLAKTFKGESWTTPYKQAWKAWSHGINALNPFNNDTSEEHEYSFSRAMETAGWQPKSTAGKITKGTLGFGLDVLLDPTTYLTGGFSALAKGTGRVGKSAKAVENLRKVAPELKLANKEAKLLSQGVNPDLVKRFIAKKKPDYVSQFSSLTHMTDDVAQEYIIKRAADKGYKLTPDELASDASRLSKQFNKSIGLRDVDNPVKITFGLENLPFIGEKIVEKTGFGRALTISDGDRVRKISDSLKISNAYSALRANIYGRKMGELFSTKTPLYRLSMEDPAKLYDLLKFTELARGRHASKIDADNAVREFAKGMNFTPAESKEILELMQDKTVWNRVTQTLKFAETARAKEIRSALKQGADQMHDEYTTALEKKRTYEQMADLLDEGVEIKRESFRELVQEYRESIAKIDLAKMNNAQQREEIAYALNEEIRRLDADIEQINLGNIDGVRPSKEDLSELLMKVREEDELLQASRKGTPKVADEVSAEKDQFSDFEESVKKQQTKNQVDKDYDKKPSRRYKKELTQKLSRYIYGDADKISGDVPLEELEHLANMVDRGYELKVLRMHVEDNIGLYSEHAQEVYKFLAKKYGYRSWKKAYTEPMEKLSAIDGGGPLAKKARSQEYFRLQLLLHNRMTDFEKYFVNMSFEDFKKFRLEETNKELIEDLADILLREGSNVNSLYDEGVEMFENASRAPSTTEELKIRGEYVPHRSPVKSKNQYGQPDRWKFTKAEVEEAQADVIGYYKDYLLRTTGSTGDNFSPNMMKRIDDITKEMQRVALDLHPNIEYFDLTKKQREFVRNVAVFKTSKRAKEVVDMKVMVELATETRHRKDMLRMETILDSVEEGHLIRFYRDGQEIEGVVEFIRHGDDGTMYRTTIEGKSIDVPLREIKGARLTKPDGTPQEIVDSSRLKRDLTKQRDQLLDELNLASLSDKSLDEKRMKIFNLYKSRVDDSRKLFVEQQELAQKYRDAVINMNDGRMDDYLARLDEIDLVLASDDALETYVRTNYGDGVIRNALQEELGDDYFKIILDEKASSESVHKWVKAMRGEYARIGREEVKAGLLKQEQFDAMIAHYVPHVLTEDGAKYFRELGLDAKAGSALTTDFGFNKKFLQFGMSRTIQGKTIAEINEHFSEALKGKNLFSDNLADIYIARALKHNEVMYDDAFSKSMMQIFGTPHTAETATKEGYSSVMHYGQFRNLVRDMVREEAKDIKRKGGEVNKEVFDRLTRGVLAELNMPMSVLDSTATPMLELSEEQVARLASYNLVYDVHDSIVAKANTARKLQMAKDQSRFLTMYDKFLHLMKLNQTTVMPSFHARNKVSNMFLNWLELGRDAIDPRMQKATWQAVRLHDDPEALKALKPIVFEKDGVLQVMHWDEAYDLALKHNVIDEGFFAKDIGAGAATKGIIPVNPKFDPTDSENFVPYKVGANIGSQIENSDRLLHFVSQLKRGLDPESAAESSRKYLFDYSDLTEFEKSVMKRIFPYYTWMRKNGRLQLSELIDKPGRYRDVAKVQRGIDNSNNQDEKVDRGFIAPFARDWVQLPFGSKLKGTETEENPDGRIAPIMSNPNMPFQDLGRLPNPFEPVLTMYNLLAISSPQIKVPLELATNRSFFFDEPIAEEGESRFLKSADHIGKQFAVYNAGEGFVSKDGTDLGLHALNTATGAKGVVYDEQMMTNMRLLDFFENQRADEDETDEGVTYDEDPRFEAIRRRLGK